MAPSSDTLVGIRAHGSTGVHFSDFIVGTPHEAGETEVEEGEEDEDGIDDDGGTDDDMDDDGNEGVAGDTASCP